MNDKQLEIELLEHTNESLVKECEALKVRFGETTQKENSLYKDNQELRRHIERLTWLLRISNDLMVLQEKERR